MRPISTGFPRLRKSPRYRDIILEQGRVLTREDHAAEVILWQSRSRKASKRPESDDGVVSALRPGPAATLQPGTDKALCGKDLAGRNRKAREEGGGEMILSTAFSRKGVVSVSPSENLDGFRFGIHDPVFRNAESLV